jgi:Domain of unknown function (DUF4124)
MVRPLAALLALVAACLVALPAEAQWKWKDKGGHVQYSDLPPPAGTPDQDILGRPSTPARRTATVITPAAAPSASAVAAAASGLAPRTADPELEAKRKQAEADAAAKNKAEQQRVAALKSENCSRAKSQLTTLDSGVRITRANAQGEREYLDDKQRAEETRRTRDVISTDCK